ncbi:MAG: toxin HicA [Alkaliphilus sp.]
MSKRDKLLYNLKNNPNNVKFETLQNLLLHLGFRERQPKDGSSHFTYTYEDYIITIPKHKPVNKIYVRKVLEILTKLNFFS